MSRSRTGRRSVNVWPALSDTVLAFLLTVLLLLVFVVGNSIRIDSGTPEPYKEDQQEVIQIVKEVRTEYGSVSTPNTYGNAQEITLGNEALFESGSAVLSQEGRRLIADLVDRIAAANLSTLREIVVKGHTDAQPYVGEKFPTNWELSTARASRIVRALTEPEGGKRRIDPSQINLVASGYSKYQPVDRNDLSENRRIELRLIYLSSSTEEE